ncbi:MAG: glycosyltransferase family 4 protein [Solirubrobacteraceae bacterium]
MALDVVSAILFSPRGGSAHAARAHARGLRELGWSVTLLAGSCGERVPDGDARAFYGDGVQAVDFAPALATEAPLRYEGPPGTAPIHPSFEERPGAPDAVFASLDDLDYERQVRAWARELQRAGAAQADVLLLHHLTPLNEAARRVAPRVPVVGHLHGTELLMLERIAAGAPASWCYAERWAERLHRWARRCSHLVAAPGGLGRAIDLLDVPRERIHPVPGGVDTNLFAPREIDRRAFWQRVLVENPRGWLPDAGPGSVRYALEDVARLARDPVLTYVGRFTAVKRLDLLIEAFGCAQRDARCPASLVLVGGHPGEWEGEHPAQIAERLGVERVFLAGWYTQPELPDFFAASDAVALASEREQFGQVLVEGMSCGLPAIALRSLGPSSIVDDEKTGWLVPSDDAAAVAQALTEAVDDRGERLRRGEAARRAVCERFSWPAITARLAETLAEAAAAERPLLVKTR